MPDQSRLSPSCVLQARVTDTRCAAIPTTHVPARACTAVEEFVRVSLSVAASCPGIRHLICQPSFVVTKHGKWLIFREILKMCGTGLCQACRMFSRPTIRHRAEFGTDLGTGHGALLR